MVTAHLFAGAGGGILADLILGHEPRYAVERDADCCTTLRNCDWWPGLEIIEADITTFDATGWKGGVDCLHAGVPCPKWSAARRGRGETFDGWPHTLRIVGECQPTFLFLECVANFQREHGRVRKDLDEFGYGITAPLILDAAAMGAPHARPRYWAIGYTYDKGESMLQVNAEMALLPPLDAGPWWEVDPCAAGVDDGMAYRAYSYRQTGNGQSPVQAAAAWLMLGGPHNIGREAMRGLNL